MTVRETADILHFEILTGGGALDRPIQSVYSCDLLSFVMGRAPADSAWATVMGNVNAMAVAVLADVACVVLAEGAALEYESLILDAGEVAEGLSPVTALPKLCEALRTAYVELAWTEGGESVASLVPEDELGLTLRLDGSGAPVSAEFTSRESGRTLITCRIDGFSLS